MEYIIVIGTLVTIFLLLALIIKHGEIYYCRYCLVSRLPSNLLEVQPGSYICRKCAEEKADSVAFRGVDLYAFKRVEREPIENGKPVRCFDNDVGHFVVGEVSPMNFYLPIEKDEDVRGYTEWLGSFRYPHIPDLHKKAWHALSYLSSSYHRTADRTSELVMDFYEGLRLYKEGRGITDGKDSSDY